MGLFSKSPMPSGFSMPFRVAGCSSVFKAIAMNEDEHGMYVDKFLERRYQIPGGVRHQCVSKPQPDIARTSRFFALVQLLAGFLSGSWRTPMVMFFRYSKFGKSSSFPMPPEKNRL